MSFEYVYNPFTGMLDTISAPSSSDSGIILIDVTCDSSVSTGKWVRMDGNTAVLAIADGYINSNVIGLVENKNGSTLCTIRVTGLSSDVFSGLDESQEYYLSDVNPGEMTLTAPVNPGTILLKLGQPFNSTSFVIFKGLRMVRR